MTDATWQKTQESKSRKYWLQRRIKLHDLKNKATRKAIKNKLQKTMDAIDRHLDRLDRGEVIYVKS